MFLRRLLPKPRSVPTNNPPSVSDVDADLLIDLDFSRPQRPSWDGIVIVNGSHSVISGWPGQDAPRALFDTSVGTLV